MSTPNIICVIPSRIASTRLPRKPLLPINGKPMVQCVYENATRCQLFSEIIVATDSEEIAAVIHAAGGQTRMTDPNLPTGSDRVAAVVRDMPHVDIVVSLQGDEPFVTPPMLEQLVAPWLNGETLEMATLAHPLERATHYTSPNAVKVITDQHGYALYFSRAPIPYFRAEAGITVPVYHHMGLYAYQRDFLLRYTALPQTPLEKTELLEQLRALEHGYRIRVSVTEDHTLEINTPEEYAAAQTFMTAM